MRVLWSVFWGAALLLLTPRFCRATRRSGPRSKPQAKHKNILADTSDKPFVHRPVDYAGQPQQSGSPTCQALGPLNAEHPYRSDIESLLNATTKSLCSLLLPKDLDDTPFVWVTTCRQLKDAAAQLCKVCATVRVCACVHPLTCAFGLQCMSHCDAVRSELRIARVWSRGMILLVGMRQHVLCMLSFAIRI